MNDTTERQEIEHSRGRMHQVLDSIEILLAELRELADREQTSGGDDDG